MVVYQAKAKKLLTDFKSLLVEQRPCTRNANAHALAKFASTKDADLLDIIPMEFLLESSINFDAKQE